MVKGQGNYLAVLVDLDTQKPIEIVKIRRIKDIREVLMGWGLEALEQIQEVSRVVGKIRYNSQSRQVG
ncbi:Transposase ISL3 family protein [Cylindrospermopsis raciborskii CS-505]|nr:Transposase ISL3 family protein [Cylindrospermopsis raciborskii CS-505]